MFTAKTIQIATDEDLLATFQSKGEQQALATLYLRYSDLVYGVCLKYLQEAATAEDAVMNIYQELVVKLPTQAVDNFKSWLYVVAKNHCLMKLRKENKHRVVEFQPQLMQSEDFSHLDAVLEKEKDFIKLEKCIDSLGEDQKKVIQMFYLDNKCYNEIAAITHLEWNKVRSMVQNGRRNLKICMEQS